MTADLQQVCPDRHLRLRLRLLWTDEPQSADPVDQDGGEAAFLALHMASATEGADANGAAMQLVAHGSALVLDLPAASAGLPRVPRCGAAASSPTTRCT
ncbi:hypothetical protein ACFV30_19695 [Streptomyces sp. NPDC059752]|uniref:hypothetical protein n=1 Tax=unclassified Streptomyces TaxID=2593676 RepID=UPI003652D5D4